MRSGNQRERRSFANLTKREFLRAGSLGLAGLTLPDVLSAEATADTGGTKTGVERRPPAKSCILFFLEGGPSHLDLWDMKLDAPAQIRGDFNPIASTAPGIQVCEHLPQLARQMKHVALIRSVHHGVVDHNAGAYYALTGRSPTEGGRLIIRNEPDNFPPFGAVLTQLRPVAVSLPTFVHVPEIMSNNGYDLPGQRSGFMGSACDPFVTGDPSEPGYTVPGLALPRDVSPERLDDRRRLLAYMDRRSSKLPQDVAALRMQTYYERAYDLLISSQARRAFDLSSEPQNVRERYGLPDRTDRSVEARKFGGLPHLGQCMLMARRLVEAGVRLVTVCTGRRLDQAWDTHRQHFPLLKQSLLPYTDQAFSALLEDLAQRGLLDDTLVVAMGEFGRTPKLGQITSNAGADKAGRDHWPHCYTVLMAGGGIRGGVVHGASDKFAAYPASNPVTPEDVAATIYYALGVDPDSQILDRFDRPQHVALGRPIVELFG